MTEKIPIDFYSEIFDVPDSDDCVISPEFHLVGLALYIRQYPRRCDKQVTQLINRLVQYTKDCPTAKLVNGLKLMIRSGATRSNITKIIRYIHTCFSIRDVKEADERDLIVVAVLFLVLFRHDYLWMKILRKFLPYRDLTHCQAATLCELMQERVEMIIFLDSTATFANTTKYLISSAYAQDTERLAKAQLFTWWEQAKSLTSIASTTKAYNLNRLVLAMAAEN